MERHANNSNHSKSNSLSNGVLPTPSSAAAVAAAAAAAAAAATNIPLIPHLPTATGTVGPAGQASAGTPSAMQILPQQMITAGTRKDCIRLRGLPYEAKVEHILEFLGDHAQNIVYQGVHMVYNAQVGLKIGLWA
jgi:hypothetical protein